ncbi:MAG: hypothetical protein M8467_17915 [Anaerolineae bacterium]|nr:hypothetical protein [Anaerolineae bacterium]
MNKTYGSYEDAAQDYLARFRALREAPPPPISEAALGAGEVDAGLLIDHADEIAGISASMVVLAQDYLEAPDPTLREGISGQLLVQAAAELQLATELLQIAEGEPQGPSLEAARETHAAALRDAIDTMERVMQSPVSHGLLPAAALERAPQPVPPTLDAAKAGLRQATSTSAAAINQRVREVGGDIAWSLVFQTQWAAVVDGVTLLRGDVAKLLESVKHGLGSLFTRAMTTAAKTLLNVYDKLMALLGKDAEDQARKTVKTWLDQLKKQGKIDLFGKLVDKLYRVDALKKDLEGWLAAAPADRGKMQDTAQAVGVVSDKFIVLVGRMSLVENVISLAKLIKMPQVLAVVAGLQVILLAVVIYTGFDYIGYKQPSFMNLTKGVAEVIQESLVPQA